MNPDAASGYSGMLQWSQPLIFDCMVESYGAQVGDVQTIWQLARLHGQVWRSLILYDFKTFTRQRQALIEAVGRHNLHEDCIRDVDANVLRELLAVVVDRFRSMPQASMSYHLALLEMASHISPSSSALALAA